VPATTATPGVPEASRRAGLQRLPAGPRPAPAGHGRPSLRHGPAGGAEAV